MYGDLCEFLQHARAEENCLLSALHYTINENSGRQFSSDMAKINYSFNLL